MEINKDIDIVKVNEASIKFLDEVYNESKFKENLDSIPKKVVARSNVVSTALASDVLELFQKSAALYQAKKEYLVQGDRGIRR